MQPGLLQLPAIVRQGGREAPPGYWQSFFYSQLNPFTLYRSTLQMLGQFIVWASTLFTRRAPEPYICAPPFQGTWIAVNGGPDKDSSHSWHLLAQRYAYDFVKTDRGGRSHTAAGDELSDYYAWGGAVCSPAHGRVVAVKGAADDFQGVGDGAIDWKARDFRGNFVVIRHEANVFSFIAHFRKRSIKVRAGQQVEAGDILGYCGNSGHSTEPHIHFQLQDRASFWLSMGIKPVFREEGGAERVVRRGEALSGAKV